MKENFEYQRNPNGDIMNSVLIARNNQDPVSQLKKIRSQTLESGFGLVAESQDFNSDTKERTHYLHFRKIKSQEEIELEIERRIYS